MDVTSYAPPSAPLIFITGVTGYVGGRLKDKLEEKNANIRCLVRSSTYIPEIQPITTEYVVGDVEEKKSLYKFLEGVDVAFYLLHSMSSGEDFSVLDRQLAANFASVASKCGVKKIIYLGGLGSNYDENLSAHLKSRHEVGNVLRANADHVQVIEFRASIIIGSGSLSFEMIRALVERLPIMITPKWVATEAQPIAIDDVISYLMQSIDLKIDNNPILEIGGKDRISYGGLMQEYANQRGLKRLMISVPVLTPRLSSLWLALVTPLYARVGRKLVDSAVCETIVHDPLAAHLFPIKPMSIKEAVASAIKNENADFPITRWNDAYSSSSKMKSWSDQQFGSQFTDIKEEIINVKPSQAFKPILEIGGLSGYPYANWLWWLRGFFDLLVGGVGMRRGRRNPKELRQGDVLDFWRVEKYIPNEYLRLYAEMKLPGRGWLEFKVIPVPEGTKIIQKAIFDPSGIAGVLYWYLLYPIHHLVFTGMLRGLIKQMKESR